MQEKDRDVCAAEMRRDGTARGRLCLQFAENERNGDGAAPSASLTALKPFSISSLAAAR